MLYLSELRSVVLLERSCSIAADLLLVAFTWLKTYRIWREARRVRKDVIQGPQLYYEDGMPGSLVHCFLRDGTLYFMYVPDACPLRESRSLPHSALLALSIAQICMAIINTVRPYSCIFVAYIESDAEFQAYRYCRSVRPDTG